MGLEIEALHWLETQSDNRIILLWIIQSQIDDSVYFEFIYASILGELAVYFLFDFKHDVFK